MFKLIRNIMQCLVRFRKKGKVCIIAVNGNNHYRLKTSTCEDEEQDIDKVNKEQRANYGRIRKNYLREKAVNSPDSHAWFD